MERVRTDNWALGANNMARPDRLPDGHVRQLINLNPTSGGQLELRAGYRKVLDATDLRLALALSGDRVLYVDGSTLGCYHWHTDSAQVVGNLASDSGLIAGTVFNGQAYLCSAQDTVRTDGSSLKPWAVPAPAFSVNLIAGSLPAGIYKVAVTATGSDGEESGCDPVVLSLNGSQAIQVRSEDERPLRLYASAQNGSTLYYQGPLIGGIQAITGIDDQQERLTTSGLVAFPFCTQLAAYHGVLLGVMDERVLVFSVPLSPHLCDPIAGFFQYSAPIRLIAPTEGGVYVVADKTYFITELEGSAPSQRMVLDLDAVAGSAVALPDGRAAWFTRYGQAIGNALGEVELPNRTTYAPGLSRQGAAGLVEHQGQSVVVTSMQGNPSVNGLSTGDFAYLETIDV